MNYALDALWWRLTSAPVRDLAALLTAPPLWDSGCELDVRTLLGEGGFRYLLALDAAPAPLSDWLSARPTDRLGLYAENLLAFWLAHAPHSRLLAHNLPVFSGSRMAGALDFVAELSGILYHIELAAKYYGDSQGRPENMAGLNRTDRFLAKQYKIEQQLALSGSLNGQAALAQIDVAERGIRRATVLRGNWFTAKGSLPPHRSYPRHAWCGLLLERADDWRQFDPDTRFYPLPRTAYLAPARVAREETVGRGEAAAGANGLYAPVSPRPDGFWHETRRVMWFQWPF